MKRWLALVAAVAIVSMTMVLGSPPGTAQALACYPPSTINPACQPQNIPILIETGVISGSGSGGGAGTTAIIGAGAGGGSAGLGGAIAGLLGANALGGLLGLGAIFWWMTEDLQSKGIVGPSGIKDLKIETLPDFVPDDPGGCTRVSGSPTTGAPTGTDFLLDLWTNTCIPGTPWTFRYTDELDRVGQRDVHVEQSGSTLTLVYGARSGSCGTLCDFTFVSFCRDTTTLQLFSATLLNGQTSNSSGAGTINIVCSGGRSLEAVAVRDLNADETAIIWNTHNSDPSYGGYIRGQLRTTIECMPKGGGASITVSVPSSSVSVTM